MFFSLLVACAPPGLEGGEGQGGESSEGEESGESGESGEDLPPEPDPPTCSEALDILFVVDNSGSMGPAHTRLAGAIGALLEPLDAAGVDWRLGITTADNGNPFWCPDDMTTPERGRLVLSSCRERLDEYLFDTGEAYSDQRHNCTDTCVLETFEVLPTTTASDPTPAPRPWVERIDGQLNLPEGVGELDVLGCALPVGMQGCGFESQLESSYLALRGAIDPGHPNAGFLRDEASLLVVIFSDELDCSPTEVNGAELFDPEGNRHYWADPTENFPSSAVCWNAGVECVGDPSGYDSCDPVDLDDAGQPAGDASEATLRPIARYREQLAELEAAKRAVEPSAVVHMSLISGVGVDGSLVYADVSSTDPGFQYSFGIGPGCSMENPLDPDEPFDALPPVRMRDVALQSGGQLRSICAADLSDGLADLAAPFVGLCD